MRKLTNQTFTFFLLFFVAITTSQAQVLMWAGKIGGNGTENSRSLASDPSGNLVITGSFQGNGADFDPGPGKTQFNSSGQSQDIFLAKYDPEGKYLWAKQIGGTGDDIPAKVLTDVEGNIFIAGWYQSAPCDFDPGPGTLNLPTAGNTDMFFAKFDQDGNLLWANRLGGSGFDGIHDMEFTKDGNLLITGYFAGTVDFDPSAGISNITETGGGDMFFAKYSLQGQYISARHAGGTAYEVGNGIAVDNSGNIFITGPFWSTDADFDPGTGTSQLSSAGQYDMYLVKYDPDYNLQWARRIGGILEENSGGIKIDPNGNVVVLGTFQSSNLDFDPGSGTVIGNPVGGRDISILKFSNDGNLAWAKFLGSIQDDYSLGLEIDQDGIIYITGNFYVSMDIDPGAGVKNLTSGGGYDAFLLTLDATGNYVNHVVTHGPGDETCGALSWDPLGNLLTSYNFSGSRVDFDPGQGTSYLSSNGLMDIALVKYTLPSLKPYLGQSYPVNSIRRLPPDNLQMLAVANTWWWHGSPIFSPDLKEVFFSKYFEATERTELWYSRLAGNQWSMPAPAPFGNRSVVENNPEYSKGGDTLWFYSARSGTGAIYQTVRQQGGAWSAPVKLNVPLPAGYSTGWTFSMAENRNLYFDLYSPGIDSNIWMSEWSEDHYLDPVKLPAEVNSGASDNATCINRDEDFLLFASNRPESAGLHDLYVSFRNPDGSWTQSRNLGSAINATHEDGFPGISPDGKFMFFNTARTGDVGYNPYWISTAFIEQMKPLPETDGDRIAFVSTRDGNAEIYSMFTNGTDIKRLTDSESEDLFPAWAPGGDQLAFISDRGGKAELWVMESDGGNQHTLLESEWSAGSPDWSPDGFHIVFTLSSGEGQDSQICMIRPDGSDFRILEDAGDGTGPVWSADGKSILFSSNRSGTWQIYSVAPDGNNLIQITDSEINKTNPCPSPDGTMIAYTEPARSIFPAHLRIINQDGSNDRMLSDYQNSREHPCWSTDSKFLFFESARYDNLEIYSVDINGRFLTNISRSPDDELYPAIPGKKLVSGDPDADLESLSGISVWPVPTENILHLRVTDPESTGVKIIVSDPLGRQVLVQQEKIHSTGPQLFTVNLSDLNAGIYHLSILTGQKTFTQSITKL